MIFGFLEANYYQSTGSKNALARIRFARSVNGLTEP
jgi:hypothetical protein